MKRSIFAAALALLLCVCVGCIHYVPRDDASHTDTSDTEELPSDTSADSGDTEEDASAPTDTEPESDPDTETDGTETADHETETADPNAYPNTPDAGHTGRY